MSGTNSLKAGAFIEAAHSRRIRFVGSPSTTRFERVALTSLVVLLPLQDHMPSIAGYSIIFLLFAILGFYILLNRFEALRRVWAHPVFLTAYAFVASALVMESFHSDSSYVEVFRVGFMFGGAVCVAVLCRDQAGLRALLYGFLLAGLWISIFLFLTVYVGLEGMTAAGFEEASRIRAQAFAASPLEANLNGMAFNAAQGAIVALAFALMSRKAFKRNVFFAVALLCLVGSFLPFSRGGIAIAIVSCGIVMFTYGISGRVIALSVLFGLVILISVPEAVFSRMTFSQETSDPRVELYAIALEHLPEYLITGVGAGNFWGAWGLQSGFAKMYVDSSGLALYRVIGPHNTLMQATINWGIIALVALVVLVWQAYRSVPKRCGASALSLALLGVAVATLLWSQLVHNLNDKAFALVLGIIVAAHSWIWRNGIVEPHRIGPRAGDRVKIKQSAG